MRDWHKGLVRREVLQTDVYSPPLRRDNNLRLHLNESFYGPSPHCLTAVSVQDASDLSAYAEGSDLVRGALAGYLGVDLSQIAATLGASGALQQIFFGSLTRDSKVLLPEPGWSYYDSLARTTGATVLRYGVELIGETWALRWEQFRRGLADGAQLAVINSPHMPTGMCVTPTMITSLAREFPSTLFVIDQAYYGFSGDQIEPSNLDVVPNVILVRTFSKFFGLASLRIGFVVGHREVIQEIDKLGPLFGMPLVSQNSAVAALLDTEFYEQSAKDLANVRREFQDFVNSRTSFQAYDSDANFVLVRVGSDSGEGIQRALLRDGFTVRNCAGYGLPQHLRFTIADRDSMLTVARVLEVYSRP